MVGGGGGGGEAGGRRRERRHAAKRPGRIQTPCRCVKASAHEPRATQAEVGFGVEIRNESHKQLF